jgi:hypothetical protein
MTKWICKKCKKPCTCNNGFDSGEIKPPCCLLFIGEPGEWIVDDRKGRGVKGVDRDERE